MFRSVKYHYLYGYWYFTERSGTNSSYITFIPNLSTIWQVIISNTIDKVFTLKTLYRYMNIRLLQINFGVQLQLYRLILKINLIYSQFLEKNLCPALIGRVFPTADCTCFVYQVTYFGL
jgi:hypothetical protein